MTKHPATLILDDICPVFIKLAKRLNQLSHACPKGFSTINVTIYLIDGEPTIWTSPEINCLTTLEPHLEVDNFVYKLRNALK